MHKNLKRNFDFPLPRVHCGILMGNGLFGAIVWGDKRLCITLNRADFWDHRNHLPLTEKMSYANIRKIWADGDRAAMNTLVRRTDSRDPLYESAKSDQPDKSKNTTIRDPLNRPAISGLPENPSGLPMGRIELDFGADAKIVSARLDMLDGCLEVHVDIGGLRHTVRLFVLIDQPMLLIELDDESILKDIITVPSWKFLGDYFKSISFDPPQMLNEPGLTGWIQMRPDDPYMCLACSKTAGRLTVSSVYGKTSADAKANALSLIDDIKEKNITEIYKESKSWWNEYWLDVPEVNIPSAKAEETYYYGMFKFAGLTHPNGMAALLQGPWVEEHMMPECSNDYHFNINAQMCYWPAYMGNRLEHLKPLFKKLKEWEPIMRHNAKMLVGIDDGLYLTMAVSDIGEYKGGYWLNLIDFSATGWIAHLIWLYYKYSMDKDFLRDTAYPFMKGIMRTFEEILEEENGKMTIPLSTAPEYHEFTLKAGGKDPSMQLACIHFLLEALIESSNVLNVDKEKSQQWQRLKEKVQPYATIIGKNYNWWNPPQKRIALWEGQDLEWSHRHHSHLACIHPFDTADRDNEDFRQLLASTINHWIAKGPGEWIAFSFVWASIIHSRLGDGQAAHLFFDLWHRLFTDEYSDTFEIAVAPGLTTWSEDPESPHALMQMDAQMGAVNAIQEMLIHTVRGSLTVFPAVPRAWKNISFKNIRAEGAFLVTAVMSDGNIERIEITSEKGGTIKIKNNIAKKVIIVRQAGEETTNSKLLVIETAQTERITIIPAE